MIEVENCNRTLCNGFDERVSMQGAEYSLFPIDFDEEDVSYMMNELYMIANSTDGSLSIDLSGNHTDITVVKPTANISLFLLSSDDGTLSDKIEWIVEDLQVSLHLNLSSNETIFSAIWKYPANLTSENMETEIDEFNVEIDWNGTIGHNEGVNKFETCLTKIVGTDPSGVSTTDDSGAPQQDGDARFVPSVVILIFCLLLFCFVQH